MTDRELQQLWKNYVPQPIGIETCHESAVAIPLIDTAHGPEILFEVRSSKIDRQPGDICLPGGVREGEESPVETALREMEEELLISRDQILVVGEADYLLTGNLLIRPVVCLLRDYTGTFSEAEVAEVFTVPLSFFRETEPEHYEMRIRKEPSENFPFHRIIGGENYRFHTWKEESLFYFWERRNIWGYTAKILKSFAARYSYFEKNIHPV